MNGSANAITAQCSVADFELVAEMAAFRDEVRQFVSETDLHRRAVEIDRNVAFPHEIVVAAGARGFLAVTTPREYGGRGLGNLASCVMLEELNAACASTGVTVSVHNSLVSSPLAKWGTDAQKRQYFSKLVSGEWLGAYCLSEAYSGSDAAALRCSAVRQGDGFVLNGAKLWITTGTEADFFIVFARTGEDRVKGISAFLVEAAYPGVSVGKKERKLGIRGSPTVEILLDKVRVPGVNMLGQEGQGFTIALDTLDGGRLGIASQSLGIARASCDLIRDHLLQQRDAQGRPAPTQAPQWQLADAASDLNAYRLLTWRAAVLRDRGVRCTTEAAMAKLATSRLANRAARAAVSILGAAGATEASTAERLMRDARITEIYEGATDIQRLVVARGVLG
jgi:alkylation response protein AidB-like acyl-CoA dehydrogenase